MRELLVAFIAWIAAQTGLAPAPPPPVVFAPREQMSELAYGRAWQPSDDVRALYDRDAATIYLRSDWSATDLRSRATLLHELVHHVQSSNQVRYDCAARREPQAYALTLQWLREQGAADPYAVLDIDEFSIRFWSMCPEDG